MLDDWIPSVPDVVEDCVGDASQRVPVKLIAPVEVQATKQNWLQHQSLPVRQSWQQAQHCGTCA
eukprot:SAG31_NODE_24333_length_484_cov_0.672727_1_plen_63_part_10